jgi:hypothetical protein
VKSSRQKLAIERGILRAETASDDRDEACGVLPHRHERNARRCPLGVAIYAGTFLDSIAKAVN